MSLAEPTAETPDEPVVRAVATPVDAPLLIISENDQDFSEGAAERASRDAAEKSGLLAESMIEPELVEQPIGEFVDD